MPASEVKQTTVYATIRYDRESDVTDVFDGRLHPTKEEATMWLIRHMAEFLKHEGAAGERSVLAENPRFFEWVPDDLPIVRHGTYEWRVVPVKVPGHFVDLEECDMPRRYPLYQAPPVPDTLKGIVT